MSFQFNWPDFDQTFYAEAKQKLETALNKGERSKYIADYIFVKELDLGSKPPELEILEICELSTEYFRGIFKLTYNGDAFIELKTKIQANPLYTPPSLHYENNHYHPPLPRHSRPSMMTAAQPLVIPMLLRISNVQLNGIIVLSVSKTKGITLVFKNDTLTRLQVSSTFDIVPSIKAYLQQQIESQLRTFLQDTFPLVVHEYSLLHISNHQKQQPQTPELHTAPLFAQSLQQKYATSSNYSVNFDDEAPRSNTTNSAPDLTPSSSDGFSDTSSECMSYDNIDVGNTGFHRFKYDTSNSNIKDHLSPIMITSHNRNFSDTENDGLSVINNDAHQHYHDLDFPSSTTGLIFHRIPPSCAHQPNDDDGVNTNISSQQQQTHYHDDKPPTIFFDQPILISTDEPHRLIRHMTNNLTTTYTLAIDVDNNNSSSSSSSRAYAIHRTTYGHHQRQKIPKRRIIKWNAW